MKLVGNLKWRYATKKMDALKKVSDEDIVKIKEAIQLSASSYGLQPYKVLNIRNPKLRQQLKPLCWDQSQITDASHLFIFCNRINVEEIEIDNLLKLTASTREVTIDQIAGYGDFVKGKLKEKNSNELFHWTAKQTYLALGNALNACAELKIDSTPMEGFEADAVNELLELHHKGLNACVLLSIGYRETGDAAQHLKKVRKPIDQIFKDL